MVVLLFLAFGTTPVSLAFSFAHECMKFPRVLVWHNMIYSSIVFEAYVHVIVPHGTASHFLVIGHDEIPQTLLSLPMCSFRLSSPLTKPHRLL
jgi:hypothetical protein